MLSSTMPTSEGFDLSICINRNCECELKGGGYCRAVGWVGGSCCVVDWWWDCMVLCRVLPCGRVDVRTVNKHLVYGKRKNGSYLGNKIMM